MNKRDRKIGIIAICVILALIVLAVCCLPWPTRINLNMHGAEVTADGEVLQELEFTVTGWKLDYLIQSDTLNVEIAFQPGESAP